LSFNCQKHLFSGSLENIMKTIGYLRVSKDHQDIEKNKADILFFANERKIAPVSWVDEIVSGTVSWRKRKIAEVFDQLQAGDNLIVSELSRLGRSMLECMEMCALASQKQINIYALKGNWQLDDSIQSKILAMVFSMAAEIERELISKRTKEALAAKKKQGIKLGRPKGVGKSKLDAYRVEIEALLNNGSTQRFIAQRYGTTETNLSRWLLRHGLRRK